jgi:WD repeat and SOF domain-containing protein 1
MNIRIWKANASKPLGVVKKRHENALNYKEALKDKFKYVREIKRISKHRHLPKYILSANKKR